MICHELSILSKSFHNTKN